MSALLITEARIATPTGVVDGGWLVAVDGSIAAFGPGSPDHDQLRATVGSTDRDGWDPEVIDAEGSLLVPGFIDIHVHGARGHDTMDGEVAGLDAMARFFATHGVTSFLGTTWTASEGETLHALHGVARGMQELDAGARLLGAHMEGPYLARSRCGAQDVRWIRPGDLAEAERFLDTGVVRLMTVAPEVPGNLEVIEACRRRGTAVAAGHTDATYDQLLDAVARGVRHVTHTFNAMPSLHHRDPGPVAAAIDANEVTVELIADGVHVHPAMMRLLYAACGADRVVLVTDAMHATGMSTETFPLGDRIVKVGTDAVRLADGTLAGSILTLDVGLRHLSQATGQPISTLWPTVSRNAARLAGVRDRKGAIQLGMDADLVLVDDRAVVRLTVVEGRVVHRASVSP